MWMPDFCLKDFFGRKTQVGKDFCNQQIIIQIPFVVPIIHSQAVGRQTI